jgi:hypothetical protein
LYLAPKGISRHGIIMSIASKILENGSADGLQSTKVQGKKEKKRNAKKEDKCREQADKIS